jgi:hypothetical protein
MSRLGRNPFAHQKAPGKKKPLRAADIVREMNEAAAKATAATSDVASATITASDSASSSIPASAAKNPSRPGKNAVAQSLSLRQKVAEFVLVDLRAEGYMFGLKAYLLGLSVYPEGLRLRGVFRFYQDERKSISRYFGKGQ